MRSPALVLVCVVVLSGCQCAKPRTTLDLDAGETTSCQIDADCAAGEVCVEGVCRAVDSDGGRPCQADTDCLAGEVCAEPDKVCRPQNLTDGGVPDAGFDPGECLDGEVRTCGVSKIGECHFGTQRCNNGRWGACAGAAYPSSEACDSKDNDCNGLLDDPFDKLRDINNCGVCGHVCAFPFATPLCDQGACAMGACQPSHWDLNHDPIDGCEYPCALTNGGSESCDGVDNDCDGEVDELLGQTVCGVGECERTVENCVSGVPQACAPGSPSPEICDGKDNDCDGSPDDGLADLVCGQGECFRSVTACVGGVPQSCVPGTPASVEICDGKDDNCNGLVDDGCPCTLGAVQSCYSGSPGTAGKGVCVAGLQTCGSDGWGPCLGQVVDSSEVCDGKDNNCNLSTDEGLGSTSCGQGACARTVANCSGGAPQTCVPGASSPEACNGADDDCDGSIDEGLGSVTCGVGACRVTVQACVAGVPQTCTPGTPGLEVCDGVDNNCEGRVDETFPESGFPCSTGLRGACAVGAKVCTAGAIQCQQTVFPVNEICGNGIDDNCNGQVDGLLECGGCNSSVDDDADGTNQCADCNDHDGTIYPGATEVCNGKDDDCDGFLDEGFDVDLDSFTTCGTVPSGGVDVTRKDCNDNNAFVFPGKVADCGWALTPTSPNGVDDNCNGYVDETCGCTPLDKDGDGVSTCAGDCDDNDSSVRPGLAEACDGKDNDCDKDTVDNCGVSDPCGYKKGASWVPWSSGTDQCRPDLICVSNVATGALTCGSFCNQTQGLGLGDSCASNEGCYRTLIDSDNQHLCSVLTTGASATGAACSVASNCRTGDCLLDGTTRYCSDKCTHEAGCGLTTTCTLQKDPVTSGPFIIGYYYQSYCRLDSKITGTKTTGQTCTGSECRGGTEACFNGKCVEPCCNHADCAGGFSCSVEGPRARDGYTSGGRYVVSFAPVCLASTAGRVAGQACAANSDCRSNFCVSTLNICTDVCCNDASCPNGTTCEPVNVRLTSGEVSFIRACVFSPVPTELVQK